MSNRLFRSYLIASPLQADEIEKLDFPLQWRIITRSDPSFRHWFNKNDDSSQFTFFQQVTDEKILQFEIDQIRGREVLIETDNESDAFNISSLIQVGTLLGYPDLMNSPTFFGSEAVENAIEDFMKTPPFSTRFRLQDNILYACNVAINAWQDLPLQYAIEKYYLSISLDSFTPHSASPNYGQVFSNQYSENSHRVRAATAIVLAFSVIEELGLEIRSSQNKPRFIDGEWNPKVKEDVENRLRLRKIDFSENIDWIHRGAESSLEYEVKPSLGEASYYSDGELIRDKSIRIIDGLHNASYIRNFIVAHKYHELVNAISPYDVHNIQSLARRLILSSLGLFKNYSKTNLTNL
jgi:hypothetical protein